MNWILDLRLRRLSLKYFGTLFAFSIYKNGGIHEVEITYFWFLWSLIVPHIFIHTVHPDWIYGTTLVYWRCPCHHVISSTTFKAMPSLRQKVVTNSNVVGLYCVVSWSFILIYYCAGWAGIYIFQNNSKHLIENFTLIPNDSNKMFSILLSLMESGSV